MAIKSNQLIEVNGKMIKAEELSENSSKRVICICDFCGKEVSRILKHYNIARKKHNGLYCCKECSQTNPELLKEKQEKTIQTNLEKYGVKNPMQTEEIAKKQQEAVFEKHGVYFSGQVQEGIEKRKQTCLEKYGATTPLLDVDRSACYTKEAREKAKRTCRERHGGVGFEIKANWIKAQQAIQDSGKVQTSKVQIDAYEKIKKLYPKAIECELNKPVDVFSLDIGLNLDGTLIDVEIDGKYWHQDQQRDIKRDKVLQQKGYKILRIKVNYLYPTEEELKNNIDKLYNSVHNFYEIKLSDFDKP